MNLFDKIRAKLKDFEGAIKIINEIEAEYSVPCNTCNHINGWIPCNKKMPEVCEYVLVWVKGRFIGGTYEGEKCQWYGIGVRYSKKWAVYQCKDIKDIEVIAWRPLPEPYKEVGAE